MLHLTEQGSNAPLYLNFAHIVAITQSGETGVVKVYMTGGAVFFVNETLEKIGKDPRWSR